MSFDIGLASEEPTFQLRASAGPAASDSTGVLKVPDARQVQADILSGTLAACETKRFRTVRRQYIHIYIYIECVLLNRLYTICAIDSS